jgi:hypothetical protein
MTHPAVDQLPPVLLTLYHGDGVVAAAEGAAALLRRLAPAPGEAPCFGVQLHAAPRDGSAHYDDADRAVRAIAPGIYRAAGLAFDGWVANYDASNARGRQTIVDLYRGAARNAFREAGCRLFVLNPEAAGKQHPAAMRGLAADVIDGIRADCPGMALGHTAYDRPTSHAEERGNGGALDADDEGYPHSVFYGGYEARAVVGVRLPVTGRVDVGAPQVYAAPAKDPATGNVPMAAVGALARREAAHVASWQRACALKWIDPTCPVIPYVQIHHVRAEDTVALCVRRGRIFAWAAPTRMDDDGAAALLVLVRAARGTLTLSGLSPTELRAATAWVQARIGATPDGRWGDKSAKAAADVQKRAGLSARGEFDQTLLDTLLRPR